MAKKNTSVLDQVRRHTGKVNSEQIKMIIYGPSGAGKTVFACSAPQELLVLNADKGMASVRSQVNVVDIDDWETLYSVVEALVLEEHNLKTVVLDSLNEVQRLCMKWVVNEHPSINRAYGSQPAMGDYGKMFSEVDDLLRALRDLPMNVVMIAQEQARGFDTDIVTPQLTGKSTVNNIARMMDIIGYIYIDEGEDGIPTRAIAFDYPHFLTKDRSGKLPPIMQIRSREEAWNQMLEYIVE